MPSITKTFHPKSRKEWRDWLIKNHKKEKTIFLVKYKKHTNKPSISHKEAMEEAICFGWIDTTVKKLDDERYGNHFVKRNEKSRWSKNTLSYAKKMVKEKLMSPFGMKMYREGLKKPTIDHNLPRNPNIPNDLKKALKESNALENFRKFAPSYRRTYIWWIERAKRKETRDNRIKETVKRALANKKQFL